jgi:hypothetical protein
LARLELELRLMRERSLHWRHLFLPPPRWNMIYVHPEQVSGYQLLARVLAQLSTAMQGDKILPPVVHCSGGAEFLFCAPAVRVCWATAAAKTWCCPLGHCPLLSSTSQSDRQKSDVLLLNCAANATPLAVGSLGHRRIWPALPKRRLYEQISRSIGARYAQ